MVRTICVVLSFCYGYRVVVSRVFLHFHLDPVFELTGFFFKLDLANFLVSLVKVALPRAMVILPRTVD